MDKTKQQIIETVANKYKSLNESNQMYVLGIMEGMQIEKELNQKKTA
jgi:hypothetical protein